MSDSSRPILLLARTGFIIRNLLLGTFAEQILKHRKLVVAVPNPEDPNLLAMTRNRGVTLIPFPEVSDRVDGVTYWEKLKSWHVYMYRFRQAERNPESLKIQTRLFESRHSFLGDMGIRLLMAMGYMIHFLGLMKWCENQYLESINRWDLTQKWKTLIQEHNPQFVISTMLSHSTLFYPSMDLPPVLAAHSLGIPVGTLIQSWDNLSSKTSVFPTWMKRYWVWSDFMKEEMLQFNKRISSKKIYKVGSPQFDFHLDKSVIQDKSAFAQKVGLDAQRSWILLGTSTALSFPQEPSLVLELVESIHKHFPDMQTLIRLHPKDEGDRWEVFKNRIEAAGGQLFVTSPETHMDHGGFVPPKDFYSDQINSIYHSSVVINMSSTLTVDAAIVDRPVICLAYDLEKDPKFPEGRAYAYSKSTHYDSLVKTGGVRVIYSLKECIEAIENYRVNPQLDQAKRKKIVQRVTGKVDGQAGKRLAQDVLECLALQEKNS